MARKLNKLLGEHIWALLPKLQADISGQLRQVTAELEIYGRLDIDTVDGQAGMVRKLLSKFEKEFAVRKMLLSQPKVCVSVCVCVAGRGGGGVERENPSWVLCNALY